MFFHFVFTYISIYFLLLYGMCLMFSWGYYIRAADICAWVYFMYFDRVSCFSLGTWIGSNDLIMGSVCVTDKIYETTAWQK